MARLKDVGPVFRSVGWWTFGKRIWQQIIEDQVFTWSAALAYYWLLAIFPFLFFLLSLVPLIPERFKPNVSTRVSDVIDQTIPSPAAGQIIKDQFIKMLNDEGRAKGFLSFSLLVTAWAASSGMSMTMLALDKAYDIERGRSFFRHRFQAILLTIFVATFAIVVMVLLPISSLVLTWIKHHAHELNIPIHASMWLLVNVTRYTIALSLMVVITALVYHFGPHLKRKFRMVTPGAVFSIAGWILMGILFRVYIQKFGGEAKYSKTYGTVAGLVILLLFFYIDAMVLLVGAEINSEIDFAVEKELVQQEEVED